jgi:drug/metabolite transporter (DMT)-like permease
MGLVIALGLIVLATLALLVRRSPRALLLGTLLAGGAAVVWLAWAEQQYRGDTGCPWLLPNRGHPVLVGAAASLGAAAIMTGARWKQDPRGWAATLGLATGVLAGVVILVIAFLFGAGLRCQD